MRRAASPPPVYLGNVVRSLRERTFLRPSTSASRSGCLIGPQCPLAERADYFHRPRVRTSDLANWATRAGTTAIAAWARYSRSMTAIPRFIADFADGLLSRKITLNRRWTSTHAPAVTHTI